MRALPEHNGNSRSKNFATRSPDFTRAAYTSGAIVAVVLIINIAVASVMPGPFWLRMIAGAAIPTAGMYLHSRHITRNSTPVDRRHRAVAALERITTRDTHQ